MKTRREFFRLFGKAALVGGVVAAVPATALGLVEGAKTVGIKNTAYDLPYATSGYMRVENDRYLGLNSLQEQFDKYYRDNPPIIIAAPNPYVGNGKMVWVGGTATS